MSLLPADKREAPAGLDSLCFLPLGLLILPSSIPGSWPPLPVEFLSPLTLAPPRGLTFPFTVLPEVLSSQPTRQIWSADVSCLFCNAYFFFFNLLPTFKNRISHKNPELWLLLKSWNIWPHGSSSPTWQQSTKLHNDRLSSGGAGAP